MQKIAFAGLSFRRVLCIVLSVCMAALLFAACAPSTPAGQPPMTMTQAAAIRKETPSSIVLVNRSPEPSITPAPTFTPAPTQTPNTDPAFFYGSLTVTLDYAGQTVELKKGQNFLLSLGGNFTWEVTFDPAEVVSRNMKITPEFGEQGVYVARRMGKTTLQAVGEPVCRQQTPPCSRPSVLFRLFVVVK